MGLGQQDLLVLRIGDEQFALPVEAVEELVESPKYRPVPGGATGLLGVFTLGGRLLSLHDPAPLLGATLQGNPVALVMRAGARMLAIAVDDADDVITVDLADVREAPRSEDGDDLVVGILWRRPELITLLDARAVGAACAERDEATL